MNRHDPSRDQLDGLLDSLDRVGATALTRRRTLQIAAGIAAGTIAGSRLSPLRRYFGIEGADATSTQGTIVLVYLDGGNDGLNTLVPLTDPLYPQYRGSLAIDGATTLGINAEYGLNPALPYLHQMYANRRLAVIRGVGYGPANLSHFASIDHWHNGFGAANTAPQAVPHSGWIGRYADSLGTSNPFASATMGTQVPLSMRGLSSTALLIPTLEEVLLGSRPNELNDAWLVSALSSIASGGTGAGPLANALASTAVKATQAAPGVTSTWNDAGGTYIGRQMLMAANLINAQLGTRVITVGFDGFDTHASQRATHQKLLSELDTAISGFFGRLSPSLGRNVTVMTYSEFGRRARANDSDGTDHGTSSVAMLVGANVAGGIYGDEPGLARLDVNGNPFVTTDFRRVYATVLQGWLQTDTLPILGASHEVLPVFAAPPGLEPTTTTSTTTPTTTPTTTVVPTTALPTTVTPTTATPTTVVAPLVMSPSIALIGEPRSGRASRFLVDRPRDTAGDKIIFVRAGAPVGEIIETRAFAAAAPSTGGSTIVSITMPAVGNYEARYLDATGAQLAVVNVVVQV